MKLVAITAETEGTFLRCLHDEKPADPRAIALRRRWHDRFKERGLRAKVLVLPSGEVVGLCQYLPIEASPFLGEDLWAILCIWVHGYDHHVGNRQGNGYGRFILEQIEADARASGTGGLLAWGMDFPYWNPVAFYEHMGYVRADQDGQVVLVWKRFRETTPAPRLQRMVTPQPSPKERVDLTAYVSGWCTGGCYQSVVARDASAGLEAQVDYREIDTSDPVVSRSLGISDGLFLDGQAYRPEGPPFSADELRADILKLAAERNVED